MRKGKVIAVVNQKGGVGKTTTTFNLGACLVEQGKKVLLVDLDQQGNLTYCTGHEVPDDVPMTIANLMNNEIADIDYNITEYIGSYEIPTVNASMDYICCNALMSTVEVNLVNAYCREAILKRVLERVTSKYDYILLDCGPSLGMITINALTASNSVLIPLQAEKFSALGLELLLKNILRVKRHLNADLDIEGVLFVAVPETELETKETVEEVSEKLGTAIKIYDYMIPRLTEVKKANRKQVPMVMYEDKSKGIQLGESIIADRYRELAKEVMANE